MEGLELEMALSKLELDGMIGRTEAVLLAALRATGPTERAERRHDLANIVIGSWLGARGREERVN